MRQNNEDNNYDTLYIKDEISKCEDIDELKEKVFPMLKEQQEHWKGKINEIISGSGLSKEKFGKAVGVSRQTVNKWCNGSIPRNREDFLKIGMAAGYNREEMNRFLMRYGRYPALYSKDLGDCVCMFVLGQNYGEETLTKYNYILDKIKNNLQIDENAEAEDIDTLDFDEKLSDVKNEDDLEYFINENSKTFKTAYNKFYAYVNMYMKDYMFGTSSIYELALVQNWSSSLRQAVSAINNHKWYPTRKKIISLGLHLCMEHEDIDEMLALAHMEPLCAKNIFESIIMFILDDASLNDLLNKESEEEDFDFDAFFEYARDILSEVDLPEVEDFISELSEVDEDESW